MLENGVKYLSVQVLHSIISELDCDCSLVCNGVGNLTIIKDDISIGFIDFVGDGEICYFNNDDSEDEE